MAKPKEPVKSSMSRREFAFKVGALGLTALLPRAACGASVATQRLIVRPDAETGVIHPELHGQFAEHLGSCVYGGLWLNKASRIPNVDGYRQQAIAYLRDLEIPVLRWPGGCFADDYHWRDGVGPMPRRPERVNIHWGGYVEDNSFDQPDRIVPRSHPVSVEGSRIRLDLPAMSVATVILQLA